jgi:WD40 repeat protein
VTNQIWSLAASPDGRWLAVGESGILASGGISIWDMRNRSRVAHLADDEKAARAAFSPTQPLLAYSSGTMSASGPLVYTLHIWNLVTRQSVTNIPLDGMCMGILFSEDGKTLATSCARGHLALWRVSDQSQLAAYPTTQASGLGTGFLANKDLSVAAYASTRTIHIMDLRSGKQLWNARDERVVHALALSPDEKTLASSAGDDAPDIQLWDFATGKELGQIRGCKSEVFSMLFSPDGKKLLSASADQSIRVWDLAARESVEILRGHRQGVTRILLMPDGKTLVSGGEDGAVYF